MFNSTGPSAAPLSRAAASFVAAVAFASMAAAQCPPASLPPGTPKQIACGASATAWTIAPGASWNLVGLASISDWDVTVPGATSNSAGPISEFVVADGNAAPITQKSGTFVPSIPSVQPATAIFPVKSSIAAPGSSPVPWNPSIPFALVEVEVASAGSYNCAVSGSAGLRWFWFKADGQNHWRARANADFQGICDGVPAAPQDLSAGKHALIIGYDTFPAAPPQLQVEITPHDVACDAPVVLVPGVPKGTTCTSAAVPLTANAAAGHWNGVALASASPWTMTLGGVSGGGASTSFVFVANATAGPAPSGAGTLAAQGPGAPANLELAQPAALPIGVGTPVALLATETALLYEVSVALPGTYTIHVQGDPEVSFAFFTAGGAGGWKTLSSAAYSGAAAGADLEAPLSAGTHAFFLYRTGAVGTALNGEISVKPFTAPCGAVALVEGAAQTLQCTATPTPFTLADDPGHWIVAAVASAGDWNINNDAAASQTPGAAVDLLAFDGSQGAAAPLGGTFTPLTAAPALAAQPEPHLIAVGAAAASQWDASTFVQLYEFDLAADAVVEIRATAPAGVRWLLFAGGVAPAWRARGDALTGAPANGVWVNSINLPAGRHAIAAVRDAGAGVSGPCSVEVQPGQPACPPQTVAAGATATIVCETSPTALTLAPTLLHWTACAVEPPEAWMIQIDGASTAADASQPQFLAANGHGVVGLGGTASPLTSGVAGRVAVAAETDLAAGGQVQLPWTSADMIQIVDITIPTKGVYQFDVDGPAALQWRLFDPDQTPAWSAPSAAVRGGAAGSGPTAPAVYNAGRYGLVIARTSGTAPVGTVTVSAGAPPSAPDLSASGVAGPETAAAGSKINISRWIQNLGAQPAGPVSYSVHFSSDAVLEGADELIVPFGPTSDLGLKSDSIVLPRSLAPGAYRVGLVVEPAAGETFLDNNALLGAVCRVTAPPEHAFVVDARRAISFRSLLGSTPDPCVAAVFLAPGVQNCVCNISIIGAPWLSVQPQSMALDAKHPAALVSIRADASALPLAAAPYVGKVRFTGGGDAYDLDASCLVTDSSSPAFLNGEGVELLADTGGGGAVHAHAKLDHFGAADSVLDWEVVEADGDAPWLSVFPSAGTLTSGHSIDLNVGAAPGALAAGIHTKTLRVRNAHQPLDVRDLPVRLAVGRSTLRYGEIWTGDLATGDDVDACTFGAIEGVKVDLRVAAVATVPGAKLLVTVTAPSGATAAAFSVSAGGAMIKKSLAVKESGRFTLGVRSSIPGVHYLAQLDSKLPKGSAGFMKSIKAKNAPALFAYPLALLEDAEVTVLAVPTAPLASPMTFAMTLAGETSFGLAPALLLGANGATYVVHDLIDEPGRYVLALGLPKKNDAAVLSVIVAQPPKGSAVVDGR